MKKPFSKKMPLHTSFFTLYLDEIYIVNHCYYRLLPSLVAALISFEILLEVSQKYVVVFILR